MAEQHPVEMIMARGLATNLAVPAFLVDPEGVLVFFNDAAGELLGVRYEEAGPMPAQEWGGRFDPTGVDGRPLALEDLPLAKALGGRPAHSPMRIRSATGESHDIEVSAFPLAGRGGRSGAMAIFWSGPR